MTHDSFAFLRLLSRARAGRDGQLLAGLSAAPSLITADTFIAMFHSEKSLGIQQTAAGRSGADPIHVSQRGTGDLCRTLDRCRSEKKQGFFFSYFYYSFNGISTSCSTPLSARDNDTSYCLPPEGLETPLIKAKKNFDATGRQVHFHTRCHRDGDGDGGDGDVVVGRPRCSLSSLVPVNHGNNKASKIFPEHGRIRFFLIRLS